MSKNQISAGAALSPPGASGQERKLVPQLGLVSIVVFGIAYMSPAVVIATFGVIATLSQGATAMSYVFATFAMVLTALSYGKLARRFPESGSIYTYARRTIGKHLGFLAGWVILLDYLFLPMVAWLITGIFLSAQFPFLPPWAWGLTLIVICTVVNIVGLKVADRFNKVLLFAVIAGVLAVIGFGVAFATDAGTPVSVAIWPETATIGAITAGAAVAAYSFLGFDAVSTLSEEVKNPARNVPRGIVYVVLAGGLIFIVTSFVMQWAHPGFAFGDAEIGGFEVLTTIGGPLLAGAVNTALLLGGLASSIAVQAGSSRLLFVMGRDGVLPRRFFAYLHGKFRTPVLSLLLVAAIGLAGQFLTMGDATSLINFGAFLAFTVANVCVFMLWYKNRASMPLRRHLIGYLLIPLAGAVVDLYLLFNLSPFALALGGGWLVLGVIYLLLLTKGFKQAPPGIDIDTAERGGVLEAGPQEAKA